MDVRHVLQRGCVGIPLIHIGDLDDDPPDRVDPRGIPPQVGLTVYRNSTAA